jgi:hypothetical protein
MSRCVLSSAAIHRALLGVNVAALVAMAFYARRISVRQQHISEMIALGVILDPAAYELVVR